MLRFNRFASKWSTKIGVIALLFIFLLPVQVSLGCGPVFIDFRGYSFINPSLLKLPTERAPFFLDFKQVYENVRSPRVTQRQGNLEEWQQRLCDEPKIDDIKAVIYTSNLTDLQMLRTAIGRKAGTGSLPYGWKGNTMVSYLKQFKCLEVIDYLIFAKRCEPYVVSSDAWEPAPRDGITMQRLIDQARQLFLDVESHYLRLRYAYQMIRLAHYAKDYQQVLELYDWLMPKTDNDPSIIEDWIEGHRAGALLKLGNRVEAAYIFSRIYDQCPSKRTAAYRSFDIKTDEEWQQCLLLCKDDHERAALYALRANGSKSKIVEEMANIYDLDPTNEHLELLLVKQMHELEKDLLGLEFNDQKKHNARYYNRPGKAAGQTVIDLQKFVRQVLDRKQVDNLELWQVAEFYLEFLAGNEYYARRTLDKLKDNLRNKDLRQQLEVWELAFRIATYPTITDDIEEEIGNMKRLNPIFEAYPDFEDFTNDKLSYLYQMEAHPGKAFRIHYPLEAMLPNPQLDIIEDLIEVCDKPSRHYLERKMVERGDSTIKNDLLDIMGTLELQRNNLEAALEIYKDIGRTNWDDYGVFDPFIERINDCVHCPLPDTFTLYNKGEIIETIRAKEYDARSSIEKGGWLFYEIGIAYYNMSYFGHAWEVTDYFRSGSSLSRYALENKDHVMPHYYYPFGNKENLDCTIALDYFERALQLSRNKNPELAARAAFMAAKCEQNNYYINRFNGQARTYYYFNMLVDEFWNTDFVQNRVIKECKYFEAYVN
jgi:hypothetical protein